MKHRHWLALSLVLAASSSFSACSTPPSASPAPSSEEDAERGINERFLSEDLDVEWALDTFERESREVYACRHEIVAELELSEGMNVADVGAGTGFFALLFAEEVGSEGKVWAVDISPVLTDHLRKRVREEGLDRVEVVRSTPTDARLPAGSLDLIFLSDTYHHLEHPEAMLESLGQALRPGGRLVVLDFERIEGKSREWVLGHVRAGKETVRREIEEAGFTFEGELDPGCLEENYLMRFRKA